MCRKKLRRRKWVQGFAASTALESSTLHGEARGWAHSPGHQGDDGEPPLPLVEDVLPRRCDRTARLAFPERSVSRVRSVTAAPVTAPAPHSSSESTSLSSPRRGAFGDMWKSIVTVSLSLPLDELLAPFPFLGATRGGVGTSRSNTGSLMRWWWLLVLRLPASVTVSRGLPRSLAAFSAALSICTFESHVDPRRRGSSFMLRL